MEKCILLGIENILLLFNRTPNSWSTRSKSEKRRRMGSLAREEEWDGRKRLSGTHETQSENAFYASATEFIALPSLVIPHVRPAHWTVRARARAFCPWVKVTTNVDDDYLMVLVAVSRSVVFACIWLIVFLSRAFHCRRRRRRRHHHHPVVILCRR